MQIFFIHDEIEGLLTRCCYFYTAPNFHQRSLISVVCRGRPGYYVWVG